MRWYLERSFGRYVVSRMDFCGTHELNGSMILTGMGVAAADGGLSRVSEPMAGRRAPCMPQLRDRQSVTLAQTVGYPAA